MANNPFTSFSCDPSLDAFPVSQSCTTYDQLDSQIAGMIVLPDGAPKPTDWATIEGWAGVVDNTDQSLMKGRYLVGVGSFLPNGKQEVEVVRRSVSKRLRDRSYQTRHDSTCSTHLDTNRLPENSKADIVLFRFGWKPLEEG
jgi:hypothetical protein